MRARAKVIGMDLFKAPHVIKVGVIGLGYVGPPEKDQTACAAVDLSNFRR